MSRIADTFTYPFEGDDTATVFVLGSALLVAAAIINVLGTLLSVVFVGVLLLPFTLVPFLFLYCYLVRVLRSTIADGAEPPPFDEWEDLAIDGGRAVVVGIVYQLPAFVLLVGGLVLTVGVGAVAGSDPSEAAGALLGGTFLLVLVVFAGYLLLVAYLLPAALCSMAEDGRLDGAFDFDRIGTAALSADYALGWVVAAAVVVVLNPIASVFTVLVVGFPMLVYVYLVAARLVGSGYRASRPA